MGKTAGRGVEVVETFLKELGQPTKVQVTKKEFVFPENGEVHMMGGGRPPKKTTLEEDLKSFKAPAIGFADLFAGLGRGTTAAATGIAGDLEELYRQYGKGAVANAVRLLVPTREGKATTFPTIEEMNAMMPPVVPVGAGRSSQMADVGQFFGENNPLAPTAIAAVKPVARAVKAAAPYVARGAIDLAKSEPARRAVDRVMQATGASPRQIMAYQGSPHLYAATPNNPLGELDPTKIGSGEGAQAYGMGHYLAENKNVGEGYRNSISSQHGQDVTVGGVPVDEYYMTVYGNADKLPISEAQQQYDKAALIEMLSFNRSPNDILSYAEDVGYAPSVIDWFKTDVIPQTKMPGYLYTHDLSDEAIARMLDWDKPLSQQSQHVKDALEKSDYAFRDMAYDLTGDPDPTGGYIARTGMNPKEFAEHMRSLGVPGVKYLDQDSRARQVMDPEFTEGTRNFVLFPGEESASKIIRREKTGGAVMMGAGGTVKKGIELVDTFLNALKEGDKPAKAAKAVQPSKEVAKAAAKAVKDAEQLASAPVVQTVANPERMQFPGIYKRPAVIAAEAAARVAPESPNLQRLFGVTRNDLYEMGKGRQGNLPGTLPGLAAKPKGSKVGSQIMTPQNTQRMIDVLSEAEKHPALVQGMDPWYVMDPLFQRMVRELGLERAKDEYNVMNHLMGMASPGSEVTTEIPRGTAAYFLHKQGRFPEFEQFAGVPKHLRGEDFPSDLMSVPGHMYHKTAQSDPMQRFLEKGEIDMSSPKVPMYIQASGVPEIGFQTATPVGDAHWSRAVGLSDVRGGSKPNWVKSVSTPEMGDLGPWWRNQVAGEVGLESVPAQARAWGTFSPQTGVTTPIGSPKLELLADQVVEAARRMDVSPEDALIMFINGNARLGKKEGGEVSVDDFLSNLDKADY
jgi:hypothetical protein